MKNEGLYRQIRKVPLIILLKFEVNNDINLEIGDYLM